MILEVEFQWFFDENMHSERCVSSRTFFVDIRFAAEGVDEWDFQFSVRLLHRRVEVVADVDDAAGAGRGLHEIPVRTEHCIEAPLALVSGAQLLQPFQRGFRKLS